MTKVKPIIFNTEMVEAILDGRKSQTRRLIEPDTADHIISVNGKKIVTDIGEVPIEALAPVLPGYVLWVRETYTDYYGKFIYKADATIPDRIRWRPSIHMPKEAARLFLKVRSIRAERLQDIGGCDLVMEGLSPGNLCDFGEEFEKGEFADLWDGTLSKNKIKKYGWDANPWVWVITFEVTEYAGKL